MTDAADFTNVGFQASVRESAKAIGKSQPVSIEQNADYVARH
ncbi:hypothetical protein [Pseudophaeobacter sp.]|nr:hypothetical protein [Pseudophaeobacter sp.]